MTDLTSTIFRIKARSGKEYVANWHHWSNGRWEDRRWIKIVPFSVRGDMAPLDWYRLTMLDGTVVEINKGAVESIEYDPNRAGICNRRRQP